MDTQSNAREYLSDLSEKDTKFDLHKSLADQIARLYALESSDGVVGFMNGDRFIRFDAYSGRISSCGSWLKFWQTDDGIKLTDARFCKVPYCPMCQSRRSLKWRAKFLNALPQIREAYPSHGWVFLTLTEKNCQMSELKSTIAEMGKGFKRLSEMVFFPFTGYVKSLEVTRVWDWYDKKNKFLGRHGTTWYYRSKDANKFEWTAKPTDEVHPHFHVLALVPASYFTRDYVKQSEWTANWKQARRLNYDPIVHIEAVKNKGKKLIVNPEDIETDDSGMIKGICETLKYTIKEADLVGKFCTDDDVNSIWLKQITQQLYRARRVDYGGVLKEFGKDAEKSMDDLISIDEEKESETDKQGRERIAHWYSGLKRYVMTEA